MSVPEIARHLGRTPQSVVNHVFRLRQAGTPLPPVRRPAWTDDDDHFLIANVSTLSVDELADHLGRGKAGVQQRLDILRRRGFPVPTIRELRSGGQIEPGLLDGMRNSREIADQLNVPVESIRYHAQARGLGLRIGVGSGSRISFSPSDVEALKDALSGTRKAYARNFVCIECGAPASRPNTRCPARSARHIRLQERHYRQQHPLPPKRLDRQLADLQAFNEEAQAQSRNEARNHAALWSSQDDDYLREHFAEPALKSALVLGRTYRAVLARRARLRERENAAERRRGGV